MIKTRRLLLTIVGVCMTTLLLIGCSTKETTNGSNAVPASASTLTFPDKNLEKVIRTLINKPSGDILKSDVEKITTIDAKSSNISDLSGIETLTNLTELDLESNQITNINPLKDLTNLTKLDLDFNQISNIESLKGLTKLTKLHLIDNKINNIEALRNLTNLDSLILSNNEIEDYTPVSSYYNQLKIMDFALAVVKAKPSININLGQYLQMGKYYNDPIVWRCVLIDENGPLMLSDKILTLKAFDAAGKHKYLDGTDQNDTCNYRLKYGSNLWETSNIRSWLNSTDSSGKINWIDGCPPSASNLWNNPSAGYNNGLNPYDNEKGFLAEGNFTETELNNISIASIPCMMNGLDRIKLSTNGSNRYWVTDKMFLLDLTQLRNVSLNKSVLGEQYNVGKPTQKCIDNSEYKDKEYLSTSKYWDTWTRNSEEEGIYPHTVRIQSYGNINNKYANMGGIGVRPAFYLNTSSVNLKSGNGEINTPYITN